MYKNQTHAAPDESDEHGNQTPASKIALWVTTFEPSSLAPLGLTRPPTEIVNLADDGSDDGDPPTDLDKMPPEVRKQIEEKSAAAAAAAAAARSNAPKPIKGFTISTPAASHKRGGSDAAEASGPKKKTQGGGGDPRGLERLLEPMEGCEEGGRGCTEAGRELKIRDRQMQPVRDAVNLWLDSNGGGAAAAPIPVGSPDDIRPVEDIPPFDDVDRIEGLGEDGNKNNNLKAKSTNNNTNNNNNNKAVKNRRQKASASAAAAKARLPPASSPGPSARDLAGSTAGRAPSASPHLPPPAPPKVASSAGGAKASSRRKPPATAPSEKPPTTTDLAGTSRIHAAKNAAGPATAPGPNVCCALMHPPMSKFCHVCTRRNPAGDVLAGCVHLHQSVKSCRKAICQGCFRKYNLGDFQEAKNGGQWACSHCTGTCPPLSHCLQYMKVNMEIKKKKEEMKRIGL